MPGNGRSRGFPLARGIVATAAFGHLVANAIADPLEYEAISREYAGQASNFTLIQTGIVLAGILLVTLMLRRVPARGIDFTKHLGRGQLACLLVAAQTGLSAGLEQWERIVLDPEFSAAFEGDFLETGFLLEILIAVGSAALLMLLVEAFRSVVQSWSRARSLHTWGDGRPILRPPLVMIRQRSLVLTGAGANRAPPS